jgi:hypothetical protein
VNVAGEAIALAAITRVALTLAAETAALTRAAPLVVIMVAKPPAEIPTPCAIPMATAWLETACLGQTTAIRRRVAIQATSIRPKTRRSRRPTRNSSPTSKNNLVRPM